MKKFSQIVEAKVAVEDKYHEFSVWYDKTDPKIMKKAFDRVKTSKMKADSIKFDKNGKIAVLTYDDNWQPSRVDVRKFLKAWEAKVQSELKMTDKTFPINIGKVITFKDGKPIR